jgi:acyl carrier protein
MKINDFIIKIAEIFEDTDSSLITASTEFHSLDEYSSIIALSIIGMVDEEYNVMLKGEEIRNAATIEDLFKIVQVKA